MADTGSSRTNHTIIIMDRISVTLPENTITRLSKEVDKSYDSRSEAIRALLEKGFEYDDRITDLEEEYEERITEIRQEYEDRITNFQEQIDNLQREHEHERAKLEREIAELERDHEHARAELEQEIDNLEQELESKENTINELRDQLAATNRRVDQHQELVEYVREERELQRDRRDFERRRAEAGVFTRAKWWFTGMSTSNDE